MKIKETSWMWHYTLDEVAETMSIGDLYSDLWGAMAEDERYKGDRYPEYPDEKFESPNIVARAAEDGRLSLSHIVALNVAYKKEQER
jgi:hypothetical protein